MPHRKAVRHQSCLCGINAFLPYAVLINKGAVRD
jgi:hypothetical protein